MRVFTFSSLLLGEIFLCCWLANRAIAEPRLPPLASGLTQEEVIARWGAPLHKVEQETNRVDIWEYRGSKVFFKEGKVTQWGDPLTGEVLSKPTPTPSQDLSAAASATSPDDTVVEEILSEIMKEPGSPDTGEPEVPPPPPVIRPQEIPPAEVIE